jgi:hypothetical protein
LLLLTKGRKNRGEISKNTRASSRLLGLTAFWQLSNCRNYQPKVRSAMSPRRHTSG